MKRTIAILLISLETLLSLLFLCGGIVFLRQAKTHLPISQLTIAKNTLRQYAATLDCQRDNLDRFGTRVIPGYAVNLQELSILAKDLVPAVELLRQTTTLSTPKVFRIPSYQPLADFEQAAEDLKALLPRLSRTLQQTAQSFRDYTAQDHEKLIQSLDSTIVLLNVTADSLEQQIQALPAYARTTALAICLAGLVMLLFAATQFLLLPPKNA